MNEKLTLSDRIAIGIWDLGFVGMCGVLMDVAQRLGIFPAAVGVAFGILYTLHLRK